MAHTKRSDSLVLSSPTIASPSIEGQTLTPGSIGVPNIHNHTAEQVVMPNGQPEATSTTILPSTSSSTSSNDTPDLLHPVLSILDLVHSPIQATRVAMPSETDSPLIPSDQWKSPIQTPTSISNTINGNESSGPKPATE